MTGAVSLAFRVPAIAAVGLFALGCGPGGPKRAAVEGTVKVDGEPVSAGTINFFPADGNGPSSGGVIANGRYQIAAADGVVVGSNRVEIFGSKPTGRKVPNAARPGEMRDEVAEIVPVEWNVKSKQVRQVEAETNTFDFEITIKK